MAVFLVPALMAQQPKLTLPQAVAVALEKNPSKKLAAADLATAEAGLQLSHAPLLPQIGFSENMTRGRSRIRLRHQTPAAKVQGV